MTTPDSSAAVGEFGARHGTTPRGPTTTAGALWWALAAVIVTIDAVRLPAVVARLRSGVPDELVARVGEPAVLDLAVTVGAYVSLGLVVLTIGLCALVSILFEGRVFPHSYGPTRLRIGLVFAFVGTVMLWARLSALLPLVPGVRTAILIAGAATAAATLPLLLQPRPFALATWAKGAALAAALGVVLCIQ